MYSQPDLSSDSSPCRLFTYWYVLPPEANTAQSQAPTKNGFYRVSAGANEAEFKGWIHQSDAIEWHYNLGLSFAPRQNRGLAHFFHNRTSAIKAVQTGDLSSSSFAEPESLSRYSFIMPVLEKKTIIIDDLKTNLYKVAFVKLSYNSLDSTSADPSLTQDSSNIRKTILDSSTFDIVFVVDTTKGMKNVIDQLHASLLQTVIILSARPEIKRRCRFGIVAYRDVNQDMSSSGHEYLTKIICTLDEGQDHLLFLARLSSLKTARVESDDYAEDALAGIHQAMDINYMAWNPIAWKIIFVIGDSSIKEPNHPSIECRKNDSSRTISSIKCRAQPSSAAQSLVTSGFVISAVLVQDPRYPGDNAIALSQYSHLVRGLEYNGTLITAKGGENPEDFSQRLTDWFNTAINNYYEFILSGSRKYASSNKRSAEECFPLPYAEHGDTLHIFSELYCTEYDNQHKQCFAPHAFVRKGQLESFKYILSFLLAQFETAGNPGNIDAANIVKSLQMISTSLNISDPITADQPLEKLLQVLLGFPLKNWIFYVTIQDVGAMSDNEYADWIRGLKDCIKTLEQLIENPLIWYKLHPTAGDREFHAFISLADLP